MQNVGTPTEFVKEKDNLIKGSSVRHTRTELVVPGKPTLVQIRNPENGGFKSHFNDSQIPGGK